MYWALIDTDAEANTTYLLFLFHKFQKVSLEKYMTDAGNKQHVSLGYGYLKVVSNDDDGAPTPFSLVHCWYPLSLQNMVLYPSATAMRHMRRFDGCTVYKNFHAGIGHSTLHALIETSPDLMFLGVVLRNSLYTQPLVPHSKPDARVLCMSDWATHDLLHQCLGHLDMRHLCGLPASLDGSPKIKTPRTPKVMTRSGRVNRAT
jgi:hypothetical protein